MTTRTDIRTTEEAKRRSIGMMTEAEIEAQIDGNVPDSVNAGRFTEARTATADGLTTGLVTDGTDHVVVTSDSADKIIILPDCSIGDVITLQNGATGYELRTSSPTTIGINGGTGADAESAIAATIHTTCRRSNATNFICTSLTAAGVAGATQVAAT